MAWIESHQSLGQHPKLLRLAGELKIKKVQAIGHLHCLWWWALQYAVSGDLSQFSEIEIASAADWDGEAVQFCNALRYGNWIDENMHLHDWDHYAGAWKKSVERVRKFRKRAKLLTTSVKRVGNVTVTLQKRLTKPNLTLPNTTIAAAPPKSTRFIKPTAQQVGEYGKVIGFPLDGQYFCDYYESRGWVVGKSSMKNWQAAVRTWKKNNINPPFQKPAGAQVESVNTTNERLKREKQIMIAQEMAFSQAESALKSLPRAEFESIHAEALERLPRGLAGEKFKDSLLPPLLVEVYRERQSAKVGT